MKITRKQLRRLIQEAYETRPPFRGAIDQSDTFISQQYPQFTDKLSAVDPKQREAFKLGLDSNRPSVDFDYVGVKEFDGDESDLLISMDYHANPYGGHHYYGFKPDEKGTLSGMGIIFELKFNSWRFVTAHIISNIHDYLIDIAKHDKMGKAHPAMPRGATEKY